MDPLLRLCECEMTNDISDNNKKGDLGRKRYAPCLVPDKETVKKARIDDREDELLPGIPNDIAWQVIAPKLSGTDINTLSLVSPGWHEAVHGRWVYDAKVRSHATETFLVVLYTKNQDHKLGLYPLNGNSAYDLPPIPCLDFGNFREYKCIALDGKIYILGGANTGSIPLVEPPPGSNTMFMLDLAGHKRWKQCSSMQVGRHAFGAAVLGGKIYVIGGYNNGQSVCKCEVYDPKVDGWSSISDLIPCQPGDRVVATGGELFVYGGLDCGLEWREHSDAQSSLRYTFAYNPITNEWRQLGHYDGHINRNPWINAFLAKEKFYTWTMDGIDVYDKVTNSWSNLHRLPANYRFKGLYTSELDDEIVTEEYNTFDSFHGPFPGVSLVQSRGFGHNDRQIAFKPMENCRLRSDLEQYSSRSWRCEFCLIKM